MIEGKKEQIQEVMKKILEKILEELKEPDRSEDVLNLSKAYRMLTRPHPHRRDKHVRK